MTIWKNLLRGPALNGLLFHFYLFVRGNPNKNVWFYDYNI